jgi:hypothetical protein
MPVSAYAKGEVVMRITHKATFPADEDPFDIIFEALELVYALPAAERRDGAALLRRIFAEADIVFGVFEDADNPRGWSTCFMQGEELLPPSKPVELKVAAVKCRHTLHAEQMQQEFCSKVAN